MMNPQPNAEIIEMNVFMEVSLHRSSPCCQALLSPVRKADGTGER
jgi:hypothetical protein